jgi:hypothetical protein
MTMNYVEVRIVEELIVACLKILCRYSPGETERNHESRIRDSPVEFRTEYFENTVIQGESEL